MASDLGQDGPSTATGNYPDPSLAPNAITDTSLFAPGGIPAARTIRLADSNLDTGSIGLIFTLVWEGTEFDTGMFDASSPTVLTAQQPGIYQVDAGASFDLFGATTAIQIRILQNGVLRASNQTREFFVGHATVSTSTLVWLLPGDTLSVQLQTDHLGIVTLREAGTFLAAHWAAAP